VGSTVPSRPTPEQKCVPVFFGRGEKFARQTRRNAQVCLVLVLGMHGRVEDDDLRAFGTLGAPPPVHLVRLPGAFHLSVLHRLT
jgi:hypothetical protein